MEASQNKAKRYSGYCVEWQNHGCDKNISMCVCHEEIPLYEHLVALML